MGILSGLFGKKEQAPVTPAVAKKSPQVGENKTVRHKVAGTSFRQAAIKTMGKKNPDFALTKAELFKRGLTEVYEYTFQPRKAELLPEPENPEDPNAIKVLIDGVHVGYIKAGSCAHVRKLLQENRIEKIEPQIVGGKSKFLVTYDADAKRLDDYTLERSDSSFGVHLNITERK
jgi:hypothetical protein